MYTVNFIIFTNVYLQQIPVYLDHHNYTDLVWMSRTEDESRIFLLWLIGGVQRIIMFVFTGLRPWVAILIWRNDIITAWPKKGITCELHWWYQSRHLLHHKLHLHTLTNKLIDFLCVAFEMNALASKCLCWAWTVQFIWSGVSIWWHTVELYQKLLVWS